METKQINRLPIDRLKAKRVSLHEAGHYIAARVLCFKTEGIKVNLNDSDNEGASGIILIQPLPSSENILDYLEKRVQVLFSGALSEAIVMGKVDEKEACNCLKNNGQNDFAKARELVQLVRNIKYLDNPEDLTKDDTDEQLQKITDGFWKKAITRVESEYTIIEGLGSNLASKVICSGGKVELTEEDISKLPALRQRFVV